MTSEDGIVTSEGGTMTLEGGFMTSEGDTMISEGGSMTRYRVGLVIMKLFSGVIKKNVIFLGACSDKDDWRLNF